MTNPITSFLKELLRDRDKERLESMRETNAAIAATVSQIQSNNKELESTASALELTASALESRNRELTSAVSRAVLALSKLKHRRSLLAGFQPAQNSPPDTNSSSSHNPVV